MQRRAFLKRAGMLTILVAGGKVWRALGDAFPEFGEGPAFEPWRSWRADASEGPLALVHAAVLSSNAFNSQPWLFRVGPSRIEILADARRHLGAFDPYLRELHLSVGCALENLAVAARALGYRTTVALPPGALAALPRDPRPVPVAAVDLAAAPGIRDALFDAIPHRHTNRSAFDAGREVPESFVHELDLRSGGDENVRLFLFSAEEDRKRIADVIWDASRRLLADPGVAAGAGRWYRRTPDEMQRFRDGAYVGPPLPNAAPVALMSYTDLMRTARLFGLIAVSDRYDRPQTIRAGRLWQRAHLLATARGLAARPANGAVEMIDHERRSGARPESSERLARWTGDSALQPTFMFYLGYPTVAAPASPRRAIRDVLA